MNLSKSFFLFSLIILLHACNTEESTNTLQNTIQEIASTVEGDIGVSIIEQKTNHTASINGNKPYPMLSTVKFLVALVVLDKVGKGELFMDQGIQITDDDLLENTWSPYREKFPKGDTTIAIEDALMWMMVYSDNNMTDILIRLLGGTDRVEQFIADKNIIIKNDEEGMHKDWDSQFVNTATPNAYTKILQRFSDGKILQQKYTDWLYQAMVNSNTGKKRLKGKLPNVKIAHRTGSSFTNEDGITGAINNAGIMELPNKNKVFISVFIRNTSEEFSKGEEIIADIAKATYEYYTKNKH